MTGAMFPAISVVVGRFVFGDTVRPPQVAGLCLVLAGVTGVVVGCTGSLRRMAGLADDGGVVAGRGFPIPRSTFLPDWFLASGPLSARVYT